VTSILLNKITSGDENPVRVSFLTSNYTPLLVQRWTSVPDECMTKQRVHVHIIWWCWCVHGLLVSLASWENFKIKSFKINVEKKRDLSCALVLVVVNGQSHNHLDDANN
jgi:hypothetical protein